MALKFHTNIPVELALRQLTGELVESQFGGQQYRFSADIGAFYVSEAVGNIIHDQVRRLGIVANEPIEICKREAVRNGRKSIQWEVAKVGFVPGEQANGTFAVATDASEIERKLAESIALAQATRKPAASAAVPMTEAPAPKWAQTLTAQTKALLDAYAELVQYASAKHGNAVRPDDVRALMTTTFINLSKGGNANAA